MLKEFKEFAMRGNVVDMAVGIIIGVAFGAIIASFVGDVLMPVIGLLLGGVDFSDKFVMLKEGAAPGPYATLAAAKAAGAVTMAYGVLILIPVAYLVASLSRLVAKALGGQGTWYGARVALFWALAARPARQPAVSSTHSSP